MSKKICPMMGKECIEKECAWYTEDFDECAVHGLGDSVSHLFVLADDSGIKVDIDYDD